MEGIKGLILEESVSTLAKICAMRWADIMGFHDMSLHKTCQLTSMRAR